MKITYDKERIRVGKENKVYDKRNLTKCECGKHRYPSKLMLIEFLKKYKDVIGTAEIWSTEDWENNTVKISCEIKYKVGKKP